MSRYTPKFSQVTPQAKCSRKSKENVEKAGVLPAPNSAHVALISKGGEKGGGEKIALNSDPMQEVLLAIDTLTKMGLRRRYSAEANAHRNMLSRRNKVGAVVHPAFREFSSFLRQVGPIPAHGATLDRIDNDDPEYAPGKVRWADKHTQNGNKGDTLLFHYSRTGDTYTTSRLAKLQKVSQNTIRTRHHRGWTHDEIIEGKRMECTSAPSPTTASKLITRPLASSFAPRTKTMAEVEFERTAEECRIRREVDGEEYFIATPKEMGQIHPEYCGREWVRRCWPIYIRSKLPNWWKQHKPHVRFDDLKPHQKRLILQIDPSMRNRKKFDL